MWCDDEPEPEPEERKLTALHWAVHANDAEAVGAALSDARQDGAASLDALLEAWTPDVKAQFAYTSPDSGHNAYTWACIQGYADVVEALVRAGVDREVTTPTGETGEQIARRRGSQKKETLSSYERKHVEGCGEVLVRLAALDAEKRAAEPKKAPALPGKKNWKTLGRGVKLSGFVKEAEFRSGSRLKTLSKQDAEVAQAREKALIEGLGEYRQRPELSTTILLIAAEMGDVEAVKARLETGASVDAAREDKITPLYAAVYMASKHQADRRLSRRYLKIIKILLEAGADVNCAGPGGMTPIVCAAKHGALRLCKRLRVGGADPLKPTTQGRLTAVAAAMVMEHEEVKEYFLGPRTYFEARERQLSHAAMEAKFGGFVWVADVLESMSERERIAKEVALEAEQRKMQERMEEDEDSAQTESEAKDEAAEEAAAALRRKVWRDRFKRALARKRQREWEAHQIAKVPAQHLLRQDFLGYGAAREDRGNGGVGGIPLDNLVGVERMKLDELLDRARDLAFLKEHPVWDAAAQEVPPPTATKREKKRQKMREDLASWCSDWRMEYREDISEREIPQRPRQDLAEETEADKQARLKSLRDRQAFTGGWGGGERFDPRLKQRSPRTRPRSACDAAIPVTVGTGADAARAAKEVKRVAAAKKLNELASNQVYQAWVEGGCKTGVSVPVLVGEMGPWAATCKSQGQAAAAAKRHPGVSSCSEWRRFRRLPVRLLVANLNDRGQQLLMSLDAIVERCWKDTAAHKSNRKQFGAAGGVVACIRLLEGIPPLSVPMLHLRCLTMLALMSKDDGAHRKVMMEQGGFGVLLNAFRDRESGGECQWLGLLGLCNLAMETATQKYLMQKEGIIMELSDVATAGVGGKLGLLPGMGTFVIDEARRKEVAVSGGDEDDDEADSRELPIKTQEDARRAMLNSAKTSALLLLELLGMPAGLLPDPCAGRGNVELLSQKRARWERQKREDPTGEKEAAKKRADIEAFQMSFFKKEEIGSAKLTTDMVRHGILSMWKSESRAEKELRAKEDAEAEKAITVAVAQHGDRNAPTICYRKRQPPDPNGSREDQMELLQFVRRHPSVWRTWVLARQPVFSNGRASAGQPGAEVPVRYSPQVWAEFWRDHYSHLDASGEWKHHVVMGLERKHTKVAAKSWKTAGRKVKLGAGMLLAK